MTDKLVITLKVRITNTYKPDLCTDRKSKFCCVGDYPYVKDRHPATNVISHPTRTYDCSQGNQVGR